MEVTASKRAPLHQLNPWDADSSIISRLSTSVLGSDTPFAKKLKDDSVVDVSNASLPKPPAVPFSGTSDPGLVFEYIEGSFDKLPDFDAVILHSCGLADEVSMQPLKDQNVLSAYMGPAAYENKDFAVRYRASFRVDVEGIYTFHLGSNDGSRLWISDELVIDNDGAHYYIEKTSRVSLSPGDYPFTVGFYHKNGKMLEGVRAGAMIDLKYSLDGAGWANAGGFTKVPVAKELLSAPHELLADGLSRVVNKMESRVAKQLKTECDRLRRSTVEKSSRINELEGSLDEARKVAETHERFRGEAEVARQKFEVAMADEIQKRCLLETEVQHAQAALHEREKELESVMARHFLHLALTIKLELWDDGKISSIKISSNELLAEAVAHSVPMDCWSNWIAGYLLRPSSIEPGSGTDIPRLLRN